MRHYIVFRSIILVVLAAVATGCAAGNILIFRSAKPDNAMLIAGELYRPAEPGVFPAVILLHGCSGILDGVERAWAKRLAEAGYVAFLPDSFGPRGYRQTCTDGEVSLWTERSFDAYGALRNIQTLPYVDPRHVGLMGFADGGLTTLAAVNADFVAATFADGAAPAPGFIAAIAFYPGCGARYGQWSVRRAGPGFTGPVTATSGVYRPLAPLLILSGADDDWTPAAPCERMAAVAHQAGLPVDIVVYPNAAHSFDNERTIGSRTALPGVLNINKPGGCCGATVGGDAAALAASIAAVDAFFAQHLKN